MTLALITIMLTVYAAAQSGVAASPLDDQSEDVIANVFNVRFQDCKAKCDSRSDCVEVNYYNRYKLCQLLQNRTSALTPGSVRHKKSEVMLKEQKRACANCTRSGECYIYHEEDVMKTQCTAVRCPKPYVQGAMVYGNLLSIGSKVKLKCIVPDDYFIITCLEDGSWTIPELRCNCAAPAVPNAVVSVSQIAQNQVRAEIECERDYTLFHQVSPTCSATTGVWSPSFDHVCCDVLYDGPWKKIFRYEGGTTLEVMGWWRPADSQPRLVNSDCTYRNATVLSDWDGAKINKVKINVIKNGQIVAYVMFDAAGSNSLDDWFTKKRVLESSWQDLNPTSDIEMFTGPGQDLYNGAVRFFIGKKVHLTSCDGDLGWLAVTWKAYPCHAPDLDTHEVRIVYSPFSTFTEMSHGNVEIADRFEVWVSKA